VSFRLLQNSVRLLVTKTLWLLLPWWPVAPVFVAVNTIHLFSFSKKGSFQIILFWLALTGADLSALAYSIIGSTIQNVELLHRLARATIVCPLPHTFLITPMTLLALKVIFFCVLLELRLYKEFPVETFAVIKNRIVRAAIVILSVSLRFLHQNHNFRQQD